MSAFLALAWNGFREARRNRVTVVVGAFALVLLLSSTLVTEVTVRTFQRVLVDFGLGTMSLILVFLAIFLSSGLLAREIERRTIFLMVSKPLSRTSFLLGRLCGNMITLLVLLVGMSLLFFSQMLVYGAPITQPQLIAVLGLGMELLVLTSIGFLFSSFASQTVSAMATTGLYFAGHLSGDIYRLAAKSTSTGLQLLGKAIYYVLPNLERLNFRPMAAYNVTVPTGAVLTGLAYGLLYAAALCTLSSIIFARRDFK